jgi:hypothetical protein
MLCNGHHMPEHLPNGVGAGDAWQLPPMLQAFSDLKPHLTFVSGLENQQRRQQVGDHAIGCGAMLTARKPTKNVPVLSMSVDQAIADELQKCGSGLHSLQLGTHNVGPPDEFGTYYTRSISWRGASTQNPDGSMAYPAGDATPLGKEVDPQLAFDRLFAGEDPRATAVERQMRRELRRSVLDAVLPQIQSLQPKLGQTDRKKLDELLTGIRSLETELDAQSRLECIPPDAPAADIQADSILLAGGLGGLVTQNRHVRFPTSKDWTQVKTFGDFYITLLSLFGVHTSAFGDDGKEAIQWHV